MKPIDVNNQIQSTWDTIASSFDKTRKNPWKPCTKFIQRLPKSSIVGDFACGNGRHTIEIMSHCSHVIGIDISRNFLTIIKEKIEIYDSIDLIHGTLINVPLSDECLDAILCIAAIHNIPSKKNRLLSLTEIYRVLKPNSTALISLWAKDQEKFKDARTTLNNQATQQLITEAGDVFIYWNQDNLHVPRFYHLYEKEEIINELKTVGFNILSIQEVKISTKNKPDNYFITVIK